MSNNPSKGRLFSSYQIFVIAILSILQFSIILDFMVLSPLGAILMPKLKITTVQFGWVVSAYAFSAAAAGFLSAGFADKFDRKKFLLFFYTGFLIGTVLCALAPDYNFLLIARIVTGIFGGVVGSVGFAIITDLFPFEVRGRVMGFTQMSFAVSQILGLPIGLKLATMYEWHAPFWMISIFGAIVGILILVYLKPIDGHLKIKSSQNPFSHRLKTFSSKDYLKAFFCTSLLATGGFMLMPFGSAFSTNNLGLNIENELPFVYSVTGFFSIITGPFIGKLSDKLGKLTVFTYGSILAMIMVGIYTQLVVTPLWVVIVISVIMFASVSSRMISSSALVSAIPATQDRGAFMSINSSIQQIAGGIGSIVAGLIVTQKPNGFVEGYPMLGYVVMGSMAITIVMMYYIDKQVTRMNAERAKVTSP